ncbi:MAG: hypothetical protein J6M18_04425 [Actinomycetaceae bacterium]|nr:hypothetical protein [Actinomycetaceae bacterium]
MAYAHVVFNSSMNIIECENINSFVRVIQPIMQDVWRESVVLWYGNIQDEGNVHISGYLRYSIEDICKKNEHVVSTYTRNKSDENMCLLVVSLGRPEYSFSQIHMCHSVLDVIDKDFAGPVVIIDYRSHTRDMYRVYYEGGERELLLRSRIAIDLSNMTLSEKRMSNALMRFVTRNRCHDSRMHRDFYYLHIWNELMEFLRERPDYASTHMEETKVKEAMIGLQYPLVRDALIVYTCSYEESLLDFFDYEAMKQRVELLWQAKPHMGRAREILSFLYFCEEIQEQENPHLYSVIAFLSWWIGETKNLEMYVCRCLSLCPESKLGNLLDKALQFSIDPPWVSKCVE